MVYKTILEYLQLIPENISIIPIDSYLIPNLQIPESRRSSCPRFTDFPYRNRNLVGKNLKWIARPSRLRSAMAHDATLIAGERLTDFQSPLHSHIRFMHYVALNTNWRPELRRNQSFPPDPKQHQLDMSVIRFWMDNTHQTPDTLSLPNVSCATHILSNSAHKHIVSNSAHKRYVVLSSDDTPEYIYQIPIIAELWRNIGYTPILFLLGNVPELVRQWIYQNQEDLLVRELPENWLGFPSSARLAQNIRIFAAQLLSSDLKSEDYLLISDADMYPLQASYFTQPSLDPSYRFHILNAKGMSYWESEYPMCYLGGSVQTWNEILGSKTIVDSRDSMDQPFISKLIQTWSGFPEQIQFQSRKLDPEIPGFHAIYRDRIDKGKRWRAYRPGDVDAHIAKSFLQSDWQRNRQLLIESGQLGVLPSLTKYFAEIRPNPDCPSPNKTLWVYWETRAGAQKPPYLDLCLQSIRRHHPETILLTPENLGYYLPSLHPKVRKIPVLAQRADIIRYAIIAEYGGFYLDADTILLQPIPDWFDLLQDPELDFIYGGACAFGARSGSEYLQRCLQGV